MVFAILFYWLATYVVFVSFLKNPYLAVIVAIVVTVAILALFPFFHERAVKKRLRRFVKERHGNKNEFTCEVELTQREIQVRDENSLTTHEWRMVEEIVVNENSVDIFTRAGGVVVRNRAFGSANARNEFVALARNYQAGGHSETA